MYKVTLVYPYIYPYPQALTPFKVVPEQIWPPVLQVFGIESIWAKFQLDSSKGMENAMISQRS